jgi:protein phosphatase
MKNQIEVVVGQYTNKGRKEINQDFHDLYIPTNHLLTTKGIAVAIADGISSSNVSQEASQVCVVSFLQDYFSTSESWSVAKSTSTIINATNSWLYAQNRKNHLHLEKDKGYVCTFSSVVLKSTTAHIFHVGDTRVYKIRDKEVEQLTTDHRTWISNDKSYLSRAMGIDTKLHIDYETTPLRVDDIFMLCTDGVYEFVDFDFINQSLERYEDDLDMVAKIVLEKAFENGSDDNLTVQFIKIKNLPNKELKEIHHHLEERPIPPLLVENEIFDGYKVLKELSHTSRSHVYLVLDEQNNQKAVMKIPSLELKDEERYLDSFLLEEWVAKRINHINVAKPYESGRKSNYLYILSEYIEGQTLDNWFKDNPKPTLEQVRNFTEQIIKALNAFHKQEMVYKDVRPANFMIDTNGILKLIDFGTVSVQGIKEVETYCEQFNLQGSATYAAPEYFLDEIGTAKSDQFSLGVMIYEMLSGELPYGTRVARTSTLSEQKRLNYESLYPKVPIWVDETIRKSIQIEPHKRYGELSELLFDLNNPNPKYLHKTKPPLIERDPTLFWKWISFIQFIVIITILYMIK